MYWPLAGILLSVALYTSAPAQPCDLPVRDLRPSVGTTFDLLHPRYFVRVVEVAANGKVYPISDPGTNRDRFVANTTAERVAYVIDRNSNIGVRFDKTFIDSMTDFDAE